MFFCAFFENANAFCIMNTSFKNYCHFLFTHSVTQLYMGYWIPRARTPSVTYFETRSITKQRAINFQKTPSLLLNFQKSFKLRVTEKRLACLTDWTGRTKAALPKKLSVGSTRPNHSEQIRGPQKRCLLRIALPGFQVAKALPLCHA